MAAPQNWRFQVHPLLRVHITPVISIHDSKSCGDRLRMFDPEYGFLWTLSVMGKIFISLQNAEYRFTTTHFRTENSQLQLRVNQLEEMNKSIDQRNQILQQVVSAFLCYA